MNPVDSSAKHNRLLDLCMKLIDGEVINKKKEAARKIKACGMIIRWNQRFMMRAIIGFKRKRLIGKQELSRVRSE